MTPSVQASESYVKPYPWQMQNYIDFSDLDIEFWTKVKMEQQFMKDNKQEQRIKNYLKCKHIDVEWLSSFDQEPRTYFLSFSNLGNVRILDDDSNMNIKFNAQFTFGGEHNLGPAIANTFITFNGELFWSVSYFPHVTDKQLAQKYIDKSLEILMHECEIKKSN